MKHRAIRERYQQVHQQSHQPRGHIPRDMSAKTTIMDAWGAEHEYYTNALSYRDGRKLDGKLKRTAGSIAAHVASSMSGVGPLLERTIKPEYLNNALTELVDILVEDDDFKLKLFSTTTRDGRPMEGWSAFNLAYTHNYFEETQAMVWLIRFNFIDPLVTSLAHRWGMEVDPSDLRQVTELFAESLKRMNPQLSGLFGDWSSEVSPPIERSETTGATQTS